VFLDIFYPPNFGCFEENGLFQHPQALALIDLFPPSGAPAFAQSERFSPLQAQPFAAPRAVRARRGGSRGAGGGGPKSKSGVDGGWSRFGVHPKSETG